MNQKFFIFFLCLFAMLFVSCEHDNEVQDTDKAVNVNISFSDFIFTFEDEAANASDSNKTPSATCKSSVSPSEAGMNRISLAVFDSDNMLAFSTTKNASVDEDFSESISCWQRPLSIYPSR